MYSFPGGSDSRVYVYTYIYIGQAKKFFGVFHSMLFRYMNFAGNRFLKSCLDDANVKSFLNNQNTTLDPFLSVGTVDLWQLLLPCSGDSSCGLQAI